MSEAVLSPPAIVGRPRPIRSGSVAAALGIVTILLALGVCTAAIAYHTSDGLFRTLFFLWVLAIAGGAMIVRLARSVGDPKLMRLLPIYGLKFMLVFFVLYTGWTPELDTTLESYGFDPQRYYFDAQTLRNAGFNPDAVVGVNFMGIMYFYGAMFAVFGWNPAAPAVLNIFTTLFGTLLLIRICYRVRHRRTRWDWTLGLAMLIPEVIWYDALTSRETLSMTLITTALLGVAGYLTISRQDPKLRRIALMAIPALLMLAFIRTPAMVATSVVIMAIYLTSRMTWKQRIIGLLILGTFAGMISFVPAISRSLGSYEFKLTQAMNVADRARYSLEEESYKWASNSFGRLLVRDTIGGLIAFAPIRMGVYLTAPIPNVRVDWRGIFAREWQPWQHFMVLMSALLYVLLIPFALAATVDRLRRVSPPATNIVIMGFWLTLAVIAVGNQIIHERYRVASVLLLAGTIWLGFRSGRRTIRWMYTLWFLMLGSGAAMYFAVKLLR